MDDSNRRVIILTSLGQCMAALDGLIQSLEQAPATAECDITVDQYEDCVRAILIELIDHCGLEVPPAECAFIERCQSTQGTPAALSTGPLLLSL